MQAVVFADVLDAWFDPAPTVLDFLRDSLAWLARSSPPTHAEGLIHAIACTQGLDPAYVAVGAGSSDLIFRVLPHIRSPNGTTTLLDATYGEYRHVVTQVLGGAVSEVAEGGALPKSDLVILVNPNNPTGTYREWRDAVLALPESTQVLIDETYLDYVPGGQSLESLAAEHNNVLVLKSLSKIYALSGLRVAYLVGHPDRIAKIRRWTPPWPVSMPAQMAAMLAIDARDYYERRWEETASLRSDLATNVERATGWRVHQGHINAILVGSGAPSAKVAHGLRESGIFVRDMSSVSRKLDNTLRIAVRPADENARMVEALSRCRSLA